MSPNKKNKGFEMFEEREPGKPENWCCTITIVILVCSVNVLIIVGLRALLEIEDKMGDPILNPKQRDLVVEALVLMSMSFGFGCWFCFCCACRLPFCIIRGIRNLPKFICSPCTEADIEGGDESLVKNMYDQRNYSAKSHLGEFGSSSGSIIPLSPSFQEMDLNAAAKARFESKQFTKGWGSSAANLQEKMTTPKQLNVTGLIEPMESVHHIEQQLYCPGLLIPETPTPKIVPTRRMTLATLMPGRENKAFFF